MELKRQLIQISQLIALYRAGKMGVGQVQENAKSLGWSEADVQSLIDASSHGPSVMDVVRMGDFGSYGGGSEDGINASGSAPSGSDADKDILWSGIDPAVFAKIWASHWQTPSFGEAAQLKVRGFMSDSDLQTILAYNGIHPRFRQAMINGIYNPISILQLNRLVKYKLIDAAQLTAHLEKDGYLPEDAQLLSNMFERMNAAPPASDATAKDTATAKEQDLTRGDILTGLQDGLFTEDEVTTALLGLGYEQQEIEYFIARVEFEQSKTDTTSQIAAYKQAYVTNVMDYNTTADALSKLNLSGDRQARLFNLWDLEKSVKVVKPTKAEVLAFMRSGIIDEATAINELRGLGYPDVYIAWYIESAQPKPKAVKTTKAGA